MERHITLPLTREEARTIKSGEQLLLSGVIYTARDAAHKRLCELVEKGEPLPFDVKNATIYYVGPTPAKPGQVIGSAGPTTSYRMDAYSPTLIREGYVYIAESPLYEIVSKGKTYFAYSDREKAAIVDGLGGAKADINRSKGLGENDPEMMWLTTMNPDTRKLIRVMPEDVERTAQMFDLLLGDNLAGRKAHIAECGSQFLDLADIS